MENEAILECLLHVYGKDKELITAHLTMLMAYVKHLQKNEEKLDHGGKCDLSRE
jgi:hypothetical protein